MQGHHRLLAGIFVLLAIGRNRPPAAVVPSPANVASGVFCSNSRRADCNWEKIIGAREASCGSSGAASSSKSTLGNRFPATTSGWLRVMVLRKAASSCASCLQNTCSTVSSCAWTCLRSFHMFDPSKSGTMGISMQTTGLPRWAPVRASAREDTPNVHIVCRSDVACKYATHPANFPAFVIGAAKRADTAGWLIANLFERA